MPKSCKDILDKMVYKGAMNDAEREKIIRNLRTKDMVELVRCKDCKYYSGIAYKTCIKIPYFWSEDGEGYCSLAERRENGK